MSTLNRTDWLALILGVVLGIAIGLFYAWVISPVEYVDSAPSSLRESYQEDYLVLIAAAYQASGNLDRAEARLSLFDVERPSERLAELAQERMADETTEASARALALLAGDLGVQPTPLAMTQAGITLTPNQGTSAPSTASAETPTPRPSQTPTPAPTAGPPFELANREEVCDPELPGPLLQVEVVDGAGSPVPGVEVRVLSDQGDDRFYTGLKPELGLGYGDFEMQPDLTYTVQLPEGTGTITGVQSEPCTPEEGGSYPGSVRLTFEQPEG